MRGPGWIFPLVLTATALLAAGFLWLSLPVGRPDTVQGTVVGFHTPQGKHDRAGNTKVMFGDRVEVVQIPVGADCRLGDVIELSRQSHLYRAPAFTPRNGQPCRRPVTPFRH